MSARRAWGLTGFAARDPQNCMSGLIQNRVHRDAGHFGEQDKADRGSGIAYDRDPEIEMAGARRIATKRGSFEEVT